MDFKNVKPSTNVEDRTGNDWRSRLDRFLGQVQGAMGWYAVKGWKPEEHPKIDWSQKEVNGIPVNAPIEGVNNGPKKFPKGYWDALERQILAEQNQRRAKK